MEDNSFKEPENPQGPDKLTQEEINAHADRLIGEIKDLLSHDTEFVDAAVKKVLSGSTLVSDSIDFEKNGKLYSVAVRDGSQALYINVDRKDYYEVEGGSGFFRASAARRHFGLSGAALEEAARSKFSWISWLGRDEGAPRNS